MLNDAERNTHWKAKEWHFLWPRRLWKFTESVWKKEWKNGCSCWSSTFCQLLIPVNILFRWWIALNAVDCKCRWQEGEGTWKVQLKNLDERRDVVSKQRQSRSKLMAQCHCIAQFCHSTTIQLGSCVTFSSFTHCSDEKGDPVSMLIHLWLSPIKTQQSRKEGF